MPSHSFAINSAESYYAALLSQYEEFKRDSTSSRLAINCALWSWHLCEWVYADHKAQLSYQFRTARLFREDLIAQCASLGCMGDIADGSKHCELVRATPSAGRSLLIEGDFSSDFSDDFDISRLVVITNDGTERLFESQLDQDMSFWASHYGLISSGSFR